MMLLYVRLSSTRFAGLCTLFLVFAAIGASSGPATAGEAYFCGVVSGVGALGGEPAALEDYGIVAGQRYAARMDLTDRPPDGIGVNNVWDCNLPGLECGTVEFRFEGFRPPQTSPYPAAVLGAADASVIVRSIVTYQMLIDLDAFVVGAVGEIDLSMVCTTCWNTADLLDAAPVHTAPGNNLIGVVNMVLRIPGVGSQPGGTVHEVEMTLDSLAQSECEGDYVLLGGDFDLDADVDSSDDLQFSTCFTGDGGGPAAGTCLRGDFDADLDVDCSDRVQFEDRWTEAGAPNVLPPCSGALPDLPEPIPALPGGWTASFALLLLTGGGATAYFRTRRAALGRRD